MQPAQWRIAGILPVSLPRHQNEMPCADRSTGVEGLTTTTDPPTRAASRATCSARNFEDAPMKDSSDIPAIISAQNP